MRHQCTFPALSPVVLSCWSHLRFKDLGFRDLGFRVKRFRVISDPKGLSGLIPPSPKVITAIPNVEPRNATIKPKP